MKYIITVKYTYQTSEDTWERATLTRTVDETTTMKEIEDWATAYGADLNTIQLHLNTEK